MQRSGFTVVELLITLVIMAILLTLGVAGMFQLQANARDEERKSDIAAIAQGLEQRYKLGNTIATDTNNETTKGIYPGINEFAHMRGDSNVNYTPSQVSGGYFSEALSGTSTASFTNPGGEYAWDIVCESSCGGAESGGQLQTAFNDGDSDLYIYEPVDRNGAVCISNDCVSYNLYWISEVDQSTHKGVDGLKVVRSTHQ